MDDQLAAGEGLEEPEGWFFEQDGQSRGPITADEVGEALSRGEFSNETWLWSPSFGESWKPLKETRFARPPPLPARTAPPDHVPGILGVLAPPLVARTAPTEDQSGSVRKAAALLLVLPLFLFLAAGLFWAVDMPKDERIRAGYVGCLFSNAYTVSETGLGWAVALGETNLVGHVLQCPTTAPLHPSLLILMGLLCAGLGIVLLVMTRRKTDPEHSGFGSGS